MRQFLAIFFGVLMWLSAIVSAPCKDILPCRDSDEVVLVYQKVSQEEKSQLVQSKKKSSDRVLCFALGVIAGLSLMAICSGFFYLSARNYWVQAQEICPHNFAQKNNWCWMVSTLQCLYPLQPFREWVEQKAKQDLVGHDQREQDRVALAQSLHDVFQKMDRSCSKNELTVATENFYKHLFEIKKKYGDVVDGLTPRAGYGHVSDSGKFNTALQRFFFDQDENSGVFGAKISEKNKHRYYSCFLLTGNGAAQEHLSRMTDICDLGKVFCFRETEDTGLGRKVDEEIEIDGKKYCLASMSMSYPGHWNASVEYINGAWYLFDSVQKEKKKLEIADMKKIYDGKGYGVYEPRLTFYVRN